jgi:hypothetical protein
VGTCITEQNRAEQSRTKQNKTYPPYPPRGPGWVKEEGMPFNEEIQKIGEATESVTSRWKTWLIAGGFLFAVIVLIVAAVKFWL